MRLDALGMPRQSPHPFPFRSPPPPFPVTSFPSLCGSPEAQGFNVSFTLAYQ